MVQAWGIHDSIVTPGWSVSTEWMASISIFPLFSLFILKLPKNSTLGLILFMCGIIFALAVMPTPYRLTGPLDLSDGRSFLPLVRCLSGFVIGVGAYHMARDERIVKYLSGQYSTVLIVAGLLFLMPFTISDVILVPIFACLVVFFVPEEVSDQRNSWSRDLLAAVGDLCHIPYIYCTPCFSEKKASRSIRYSRPPSDTSV